MTRPPHGVVRRRRLAVLGVLVVTVVAIALPKLNQAVRHLTLPLHHASIIRAEARAKHLDPALIAAVIFAESKFDPRPSPAGAQGLMQILPDTAVFLARRSGAKTFAVGDLATPDVNIAYGSYYLRYLLDRYGGNETLALAAYNGGEANVDTWRAAARARGEAFSLDAIGFPETRAYVAKVERAQGDYRSTYARELGI
jgi:soluble lytic murein transglycosylase